MYSDEEIIRLLSIKKKLDDINSIAHDYDGVSLGIIEDTLRYKINPFLDVVNNILKENK